MAKVTEEGARYPDYLFHGVPGAAAPTPTGYEDIFGANPLTAEANDPSDILFSGDSACGKEALGRASDKLVGTGDYPDVAHGPEIYPHNGVGSEASDKFDPLALGIAVMNQGPAHNNNDTSTDPMDIVKQASGEVGKIVGKNPLDWSSSDGLAGDSGGTSSP